MQGLIIENKANLYKIKLDKEIVEMEMKLKNIL